MEEKFVSLLLLGVCSSLILRILFSALALLCLIKSGSGPTSIGHNFEVFKSSMGSHPQASVVAITFRDLEGVDRCV